jgi:hypothetical protein
VPVNEPSFVTRHAVANLIWKRPRRFWDSLPGTCNVAASRISATPKTLRGHHAKRFVEECSNAGIDVLMERDTINPITIDT